MNNLYSLDKKREEVQIEEARKSKIKTECKELYAWCLDNSKTEPEAFKLTEELNNHLLDYWEAMATRHGVQKVISVKWLEKHVQWSGKSKQEQIDLLYSIGFNTKKFHVKQMKRLVKDKGKTVLDEVIYGMERLDLGWIDLRDEKYEFYASDEARELANWYRYNSGGSPYLM